MKTSQAQQTVLDKMHAEKEVHFIPWGLNYFHMQDSDYKYIGRVRHCVFDALVNKSFIIHIERGWVLRKTI